MNKLNDAEMLEVKGGAVSFGLASLITGIISGIGVFIVGLIDGYLNPNACRK